MVARIARFIQWMKLSRPLRVMQHYLAKRGVILGSGLAFQGVFAVFAALWVSFSIAGLVLVRNIGLRATVIEFVAENVPGLIDDGTGAGVIDPDLLLEAGVFNWTGGIALGVLLFTVLAWLGHAQDAVRSMFDLPVDRSNFFLHKLRDLGFAIGFGIILIVSAGLSVFGTQATAWALELIGIPSESTLVVVSGRIVTLSIMFALDAFVLASLYRFLSGVHIPWRRLRVGVLLGATATGVLKVLGGTLIGGAGGNNPLLASFGVLIGLLIWINLLCQAVLFVAAWIAIGMQDRGIPSERVAIEESDDSERSVAVESDGART